MQRCRRLAVKPQLRHLKQICGLPVFAHVQLQPHAQALARRHKAMTGRVRLALPVTAAHGYSEQHDALVSESASIALEWQP